MKTSHVLKQQRGAYRQRNIQNSPFCAKHLKLDKSMPFRLTIYRTLNSLTMMTMTMLVISFASSVFNVMMNILTAAVYIVLHRNENEMKFNILVSWTANGQNAASSAGPKAPNSEIQSLSPFTRTGRRVTLAKELDLIQFGGSKSVHFEVMASKPLNDSYELFGVMQFDEQNESAAGLLANFMEKEDEILAAIIEAFGYYPDFTDRFTFSIGVSRSDASSRADKMKLISDLFSELGVNQQRVQRGMTWISADTV